MAKKTLEDFQKQLDDLVIETERLRNAEAQATAVLNSFRTNGGTAAEVAKAQKKLADSTYKLNEYTYALGEKEREILNNARAAGYDESKLRPGRDYDEIMRDSSGGGDRGVAGNFFASKGGGNVASGVINVISGILNVASEIYIAEQKKKVSSWLQEQDIYINAIETTSRIFQRNMKTFAKAMQGALSSSFASITQGVQEGAYAAANSSVDIGTELISNALEKRMDELKQQQYAELRAKKGELERWNLTASEINAGASAASSLAKMIPVVGSAVGGLITSIASASTKIMTATKEIDIMKLEKTQEMAQKQLDIINKIQQEALEAASNAVKQVLDFSQSIENLSLKIDAAAKSMGNMLGMSGSNIENYQKFIFNAARNMSFTNSQGKTIYLDKTPDDMAKIQSTYIDESARNITMSRNDMIKTFLLGKELGDDNLAAALLGDMDYFNQTIENSTQMIHEMFIQANKAGVSNRKFAKDLQQNLKLAQKYTFKGGVESLMKMSIWAQKTRFNMQNLESIVDKITEGGIENVIKQSAELQVLGGNMAVYSDPFGMMYEAFADPEALGKRYNKMLEGMGTFNKKTGQTEINMPDRLRLQAYAKATGISFQDAINQVNQGVKNNQIDTYLKAGGGRQYTEAEKALIYNKAQYNTETGAWQVTDDRGNVIGDINNLTDEQINELMPVEERIEDKVTKIMDYTAQMVGATNHGQAMVADETFPNLKKNIEQRIAENLRFFNEQLPTLKNEVIKSNDFVTEQNEVQHRLIKATNDILEQQFKIIKASSEKMIKDLSDGGSAMRKALDVVAAELGVGSKNLAKALDELCKTLGIEIDRPNKDKIEKEKEEAEKQARIEAHENAAKAEAEKGHRQASLIHSSEAERIKGNHLASAGLEKSAFGHFTRDGVFTSGGTNMSVAANSVTSINDGVAYNSNLLNKSINTSTASNVTSVSGDGVIDNHSKSMNIEATNVTPIHDGSVTLAKTDPNDVGVFAKTGGPFDTLFNNVFKQISEVYNIVKKENLATYFHNPYYDMRGTKTNHSTSYGNDYVSTSNEINNTLSNIGQIVDEIYSFGDSIVKSTNQSKVSNNVSNVIDKLEKIAYPENNTSVSNFTYNRENGDISDNNVNNYGQYYDSNSIQTTQIGDRTKQSPLDVLANTETQQYKVLEYITREIKSQNDKMVLSGDVRRESASVEHYDSYSSNNVESILQNETLIDRFENVLKQFGSDGNGNGKPIEVKFSGSIDLKSGSQSVDILNMMREDPYFVRTLAEMLALQYSSTINGGKSEMYGGNRYGLR